MTDFALGTTFDIKFTTRRFSTGVPFTLAGTPAVAAYPDNSTVEITAGITLTVDFDARTGLHNIRVVATGGNGYAAGSSYALVLTAGTVDSVSVVGEVVGEFTLERSAAFGRLGAPAGASVSADVAAVKGDTAAILIDTAEIGTAGAGLTNINLPNQTMDIIGNITGNLSGSVGSVTGLTASDVGAIKAKTDQLIFTIANKVDASIQAAGDFAQAAADKVWSSASRTLTAFSTALALSVWDVLESAIVTASSIGLKLKTNLDATVSSRLATAGYTAPPTTADIADAVHDEVVDGTTTFRESTRLANAANAGKTSGLATTTARVRDLADTKDRIVATVDADGNRSAVTRDVS